MCVFLLPHSHTPVSPHSQGLFNYKPPSRKTVMGPLLNALYEDCQKKVREVVNFKNPDSLVTLSMDGWKAPTGEHIRNYMWVTDEVCVCA